MKNIFLVDADETLLDFNAAESGSLKETLFRHGVPSDDTVCRRFHEINAELWKRLERGELARERLVTLRFELLFEELGVKADAKPVSDDFFEGIARRGIWIEGAKEFLLALKERGRVYIVTNGAKYTQTKRFASCGLSELADGVFISEQIGAYKPSEEFAEYVEAHIPDYDRERAVWIGDSLTSDKACADTKGIAFLRFCRNKGKDPSCSDGFSFAEILRLADEDKI